LKKSVKKLKKLIPQALYSEKDEINNFAALAISQLFHMQCFARIVHPLPFAAWKKSS